MVEKGSENQPALSSQHQHGRKQSSWCPGRVGDRPEAEPDQENEEYDQHAVGSGERALRDGITSAHQSGPKPGNQANQGAHQPSAYFAGPSDARFAQRPPARRAARDGRRCPGIR